MISAYNGLLFGTAGIPKSSQKRDSISGIKRIKYLGLDAMELEYVRGTFPGEKTAIRIADAAQSEAIRLSAHGPYYINLNADNIQKMEASRERVLKSSYIGSLSGAESIIFHAGFYLKQDRTIVFQNIRHQIAELCKTIQKMPNPVRLCPELTGKPSQFGSLDEVLELASLIANVSFCIDWSHLHARTGMFNTEDEFQKVLNTIRKKIGTEALASMHMHISGIEYTAMGERKHIELEKSDMNYKGLLRVLFDNDVSGVLICESPILEKDALRMKSFYDSL